MRKLSDVCKIVGVTRRTLQEYDRIGLLHPTKKTEAGYWMYDDAAVQRLILIQIFIETGYERKAVKQLLEAPTLDIMSEFDHMISTLEERRRRITGRINTVKMLKLTALLPESTLKAISNIDVTNIFREKSFSEYWNESVEHMSRYSTDDAKDAELYIPFWNELVSIGLLHDKPVDDPDVIKRAKSFCDYLMNMILSNVESDDIEEDDDITPSEVADGIGEALTEMLSEPELVEMLEMQCGENSATFIVEAVKAYCSSLTEEDIEIWRDKIEEKKHCN